ncbi:MAG: hypothetical protein L3J56_06950 [Bacteroidales bacterium]|nr:hypothetical protein [Bacteroidales bacterium]
MTTEEIYNEIIDEKESGQYPELDELNSTSKVAVWRLMIWIFSFFSKTIHELFESFKKYIEEVFAKNQHGTLLWWIEQIKAFQYGDILEFIDGVFKYAVIDETKQIVKRVALETLNFVLVFKVATEDSNGNLIPLDTAQKTALHSYINKVKFPGTYTQVISENADDLKINLRIYYNAEVTEAELNTFIEEAVNEYIKNIVFNGNFSITELTDKLQTVKGVVNPVVKSAYGKAHSQDVADYLLIDDYYKAASGYFNIDQINIEYIPYV